MAPFALLALVLVVAGLLPAARADGITVRFSDIAAAYGSRQPEAVSAFAEILYSLSKDSLYLQPPASGEAEQVMVTYQSAGEVVLTWVSGPSSVDPLATVAPARPTAAIVRYGTSPKSLKYKATATRDYYTQDYYYPPSLNVSGVTDVPYINYTSGVLHAARLTGLTSSTKYYYRLGESSTVRSFKTTPRKGRFPLRIGGTGDIGNSINSTETIRKLGLANPDLALLLGDFSYANLYDFTGKLNYLPVLTRGILYSYQPRWDTLGRMLEGLASRVPLLTTQGNHEIEGQADGSSFKAWLSRYGYHLPFGQSQGTPFYYSANVGPVHLVSISPYVDFGIGSPQYDWLVRDLSSVDRSVTPWVVAMWHAPWYHTLVSHYKELECHRLAIEPLLYKYGVNLALHGHVHAYERTLPVYDYQVNQCGTVYVTAGNGGVGLNTEFADSESLVRYSRPDSYDNSTNCPRPVNPTGVLVWIAGGKTCITNDPVSGKYCPNTQPAWSARREAAHGFVTVDFENPTRAVLNYYRKLAPDGEATETVVLTRDLSCANQNIKPRSEKRSEL